ncbi:MAG: TPR repeat protein [Myxococcota bacterium]|jgi:TPR repeat protein
MQKMFFVSLLLLAWVSLIVGCGSTPPASDLLDAELKPAQAMPTGESTYMLGVAYETGQGLTRDDTQASAHYQTACETHGHLKACNNLGVLYDTGRGLPEDPARAAVLFERACQGDDPDGCFNLGLAYIDGRGVSADATRALALFETACAASLGSACFNLATLQRQSAATADATTSFGRGCEAKDAPSCVNYAALRLDGEQADIQAAKMALLRGCDTLADAQSCFILGVAYAKGLFGHPNPTRGVVRLKQACDQGHAQACTVLQQASQD